MRKMHLSLMVILCLVSTAMAAPEVKFGGLLELRYRSKMQTEPDENQGTWEASSPYSVYLMADTAVSDNVSAHLRINLWPLEGAGAAAYGEEATVTAKIGEAGKLQIGKAEMPFGQDKLGMLTAPYVHDLEIKKVLGLVYNHKLSELLSIDLVTFENNNTAGGQDDPATELDESKEADNGLFESYIVRLSTNNKNRYFELSASKRHNGLAEGPLNGERLLENYNAVDRNAISLGGNLKFKKIGFYFEYATEETVPELGAAVNRNYLQIGVSYAFSEKGRLLVEYNNNDPDVDIDEDARSRYGIIYYHTVAKKTSTYIGYEREELESDTGSDNFGSGIIMFF